MLIAIFFTPISSARAFATPCSTSKGFPPFGLSTSMSTHRIPFLHPVPSAFIAASFTANRPAYRSYLLRYFSQYARSPGV